MLAEQVELGIMKPGEKVVSYQHTSHPPSTVETSTAKCAISALPGLSRRKRGPEHQSSNKYNMPRSGDVMVYKKVTTLRQGRKFNAEVQVMDIPNNQDSTRSSTHKSRCWIETKGAHLRGTTQ